MKDNDLATIFLHVQMEDNINSAYSTSVIGVIVSAYNSGKPGNSWNFFYFWKTYGILNLL